MVATGFFQMLSSGMLLLLLATTTTTLTPRRASAISSDVNGTTDATTSDAADDCSTESATCQADATCQSCSTAGSSSIASDSCYTFNPTTTTSEGCDLQLEAMCCLVELSEFDCLDNEAFVALSTCHIQGFGCTDEITCDAVEEADANDDDSGVTATVSHGQSSAAIAYSCAFGVMLPLLLWV